MDKDQGVSVHLLGSGNTGMKALSLPSKSSMQMTENE